MDRLKAQLTAVLVGEGVLLVLLIFVFPGIIATFGASFLTLTIGGLIVLFVVLIHLTYSIIADFDS